MADLTLLAPQTSYFGLLNTQSSNGLSNILQVIQDALGRNTPLSLSQVGLDINTSMGGGFSINGDLLSSTATQINNVCVNASFSSFTTALKLPAGTTGQRPGIPSNGDIRYNSTTQSGELYASGSWMTINAGNPSGYYPGGPTYIQDTYASGTYNLSVGTPQQVVTNRIQCTLFGDSVVQTDSSGSRLCAYGYQSLMLNSSGSDNCSFGHMSGKSLIAGSNNSFFGNSSGYSSSISDRNSYFGFKSGFLSTGSDNSFFGDSSGENISEGDNNSIFGSSASENSENVSECCAYGYASLKENEKSQNTAYGSRSATSNISGEFLDAYGYCSLFSNILGNGNSAFSNKSLFSNIDGKFNCGFGFESIYLNTQGNGNSGFGYNSLGSSLGNSNCGFGFKSGLALTTGDFNVFLGSSSSETGTISNLTGCTLLGAKTTVSTGLTNATAIGYESSVTESDTIILGKPGTNVGIGVSDPASRLSVFGSVYFQGIESGYSSTGLLITQNGLSTSGTIPQSIDFDIDTDAPNITSITVKISVINTIGNKSAYANSNAAAIYNGITTTSVGTLPTITFTSTAAYTPTAVWSISGNNLRLTLTGVIGSSEIWVISSNDLSTFNTAT